MGGSRETTTSVCGVELLGRMKMRWMEANRILKSWVWPARLTCPWNMSTSKRPRGASTCTSVKRATASSPLTPPVSVCASTWSSKTLAGTSSGFSGARPSCPWGTWKAISASMSSRSSAAVSSTLNSIITSSLACWADTTSGRGTSKAGLPSTMNMRLLPLMATPPQLRPLVDIVISFISRPYCCLLKFCSCSRSRSLKPTKLCVAPSFTRTPS
mmetsp:Transcript_9785/g.26513  ORF Transcript_9785/g.26513 Transcript_9785/m.26513 type:complete len:214 (-) Transcript_9785:299-940(-)